VNSKRYRSQLAETTDDHLRYEFLRLLAQEGRQHFMRQIAEEYNGDFARAKIVPLLPR
jgi:F0F1-type ATP synthase delta subunit